MPTFVKVLIVLVLAGAVAGTIALREQPGEGGEEAAPAAASEVAAAPAASTGAAVETPDGASLPRLVDLGADKCIPCKAMAPILEELKQEYAGKIDVQFIDVWKNPDAGAQYGVNLIPTQIFFDASGTERFRHEGFFSKEDILAKWKELGVR